MLAALLLAVGIFALDLATPLGFAAWIPYSALVLITLWLPRPAYTPLAAGLSTLLIVLGHFYSPSSIGSALDLPNRLAGVAAIWMLAALCVLRKRAEEKLSAAKENLEQLVRERTKSLQSILTSAGEGIYGSDVEGRATFVNPAAAKMLGWEVSDLLGRSMHAAIHHTRPDGSPHPASECPITWSFRSGTIQTLKGDQFWRKAGIPGHLRRRSGRGRGVVRRMPESGESAAH